MRKAKIAVIIIVTIASLFEFAKLERYTDQDPSNKTTTTTEYQPREVIEPSTRFPF